MQIGRITKYVFLLINHKISKEPLTNHYRTPLVLQLKAAKYGFYK